MTEAEMRRLYGIDIPEKKKKRGLKPRQCSHCSTINPPTSNYCSTCGHPLTVEAERKVTESGEKIRQLFIENPQAQTMFIEILQDFQTIRA